MLGFNPEARCQSKSGFKPLKIPQELREVYMRFWPMGSILIVMLWNEGLRTFHLAVCRSELREDGMTQGGSVRHRRHDFWTRFGGGSTPSSRQGGRSPEERSPTTDVVWDVVGKEWLLKELF